MSIYFIHFFTVFLPLVAVISFSTAFIKDIFKIFVGIFLAFLFGYFAFFISAAYLKTAQLHFYVNFIFILCFFALFVLSFLKKELFVARLFFVIFLSFSFSVRYYYLSQDFPIFTSSLLDTQAVISMGFILLAFVLCLIFFFFLRWQFALNKKLSLVFLSLLFLCEFDNTLANILLIAMRESLIDTHSLALSFVAKSLYYSKMTSYLYMFFILVLSFACLKLRTSGVEKKHLFDIEFRKNEARNFTINTFFSASFISTVLAFCIVLHFDLISSKPINIDPPKEVVPDENGLFVFDIELLRDNALHRFAYITSEGKVVRFFLLNKREDKDSPVAVFDACMLCGDMGYVKRGGELICISCNVRIFLLSVGKEGGCNPIPLAYKFDGQKIIIKVEDVVVGTNYFTQIKEIQVQDPVSKTKILNSKAEYSYIYNGITYYFANDENYEIFKEEPSKFIEHNLSGKFRTQGY